jgi:hypothetical protein
MCQDLLIRHGSCGMNLSDPFNYILLYLFCDLTPIEDYIHINYILINTKLLKYT